MSATNGNGESGLTRRAMLRCLGVAGVGTALLPAACVRIAGADSQARRIVDYLESLRCADGGYGWGDQERSHLTPTFAVVGCYAVLRGSGAAVSGPGRTGQSAPEKLAEFIRTHHPSQLKKLEQEHREFDYQQMQSLKWLGEDLSEFRKQVESWTAPRVYLKQYEANGLPVFRHEMATFACRALLGLPVEGISPVYVDYLESRRRGNGSFNNTPASEGSDGNVLNTLWGLKALEVLERTGELRKETAAWLRRCQKAGGGFTHSPAPEFGGVEDVAYTWAAMEALRILGSHPAHVEGCRDWLMSLANADGGFGNRPGWRSNPMATFYALRAQAVLCSERDWEEVVGRAAERAARADGAQAQKGRDERPRESVNVPWRTSPPGALGTALPYLRDLKVFSIQLEAHGQGSPAEAVELARSLRIHMWGAKNARPEWIETAQRIADRERVPVRFFVANEEHNTWVRVPGMGTYSHTSDIIAPAGAEIGASLAGKGVVTWPEYRERRLGALHRGGGRLVWQFGENEELVRMLLDDSLVRGGFAAISTFHFGNPDFTNSEPFLQEYRGQIPFVSLQDSHGVEPWWFADMTTGFRTLFLGREASWETWLEALERNWVVAVRHDGLSGWRTWMHGGDEEVVQRVRELEADWRWWDNPEISRPMVSVVVVRSEDEFEAGRPEKGVAIRVRCAWENTTQGQPKRALSELVELRVDGQEVEAEYVTRKAARGNGYADCYHRYAIDRLGKGRHSVMAQVRVLDGGEVREKRVEFEG